VTTRNSFDRSPVVAVCASKPPATLFIRATGHRHDISLLRAPECCPSTEQRAGLCAMPGAGSPRRIGAPEAAAVAASSCDECDDPAEGGGGVRGTQGRTPSAMFCDSATPQGWHVYDDACGASNWRTHSGRYRCPRYCVRSSFPWIWLVCVTDAPMAPDPGKKRRLLWDSRVAQVAVLAKRKFRSAGKSEFRRRSRR